MKCRFYLEWKLKYNRGGANSPHLGTSHFGIQIHEEETFFRDFCTRRCVVGMNSRQVYGSVSVKNREEKMAWKNYKGVHGNQPPPS